METSCTNFLVVVRMTVICATLAEATTVILPRIPASQLRELVPKLLRTLGGPDETHITPFFVAGSICVGLGGLLRWYCYRTLGRFFTFQLSVRHEHRLITHGPYSIVRHPSYTGAVFLKIGLIIFYGSPESWLRRSGLLRYPFVKGLAAIIAGFVAASILGVIVRSPQEDRMLQNEFGKEWEDWARHVKYRILPWIY